MFTAISAFRFQCPRQACRTNAQRTNAGSAWGRAGARQSGAALGQTLPAHSPALGEQILAGISTAPEIRFLCTGGIRPAPGQGVSRTPLLITGK